MIPFSLPNFCFGIPLLMDWSSCKLQLLKDVLRQANLPPEGSEGRNLIS